MAAAKDSVRQDKQPARARPGVYSVGARVIEKSLDDNIFPIAAQLAFYFLLGLFPFLLLLTTLLPYFSKPDSLEGIKGFVYPMVPPGTFTFVVGNLAAMLHVKRQGLLSFSVIMLLWSASGALHSIIAGLNVAYDVEETRPFWRTRLNAMALTIILGCMAIIGTFLLTFGKLLNALAARYVPVPIPLWVTIRWMIALLFIMLTLDIIYYTAPNVKHPWRWFSPGAIVATPMWVAMSVGYSFYLSHFARSAPAYGDAALAAIITLMLWFYASGVVLLIGGELNSILEKGVFRDVQLLAGPWRWRRRKPKPE